MDKVKSEWNWESKINTQFPELNNAGEYKRIHSDFHNYEHIVNYREFAGIKSPYVEISEEFILLNDLYFDKKNNQYIKILENGESEVVIKIKNDVCAFIKLGYLVNYISAKQMFLSIYFDSRAEFNEEGNDQLSLDAIKDDFQYKNLTYHFGAGKRLLDKSKLYSFICGKMIIEPKPIKECGFYPFEKKKTFENYIIGHDEKGDNIEFTSNPDLLGNYFDKKRDSPHNLTPVFFKKEVLNKYYNHSELYSVESGYLRCKNLWGIPIDNFLNDYVSAYLCDLGERLPQKEQKHWRTHNVLTDAGLSKTKINSDFLGLWVESDKTDIKFRSSYLRFVDEWKKKYGWCLFKPFNEKDQYVFQKIHLPLNNNQDEFDQLVLYIVKSLIDSLNEKEITKLIKSKIDKDTKGISKLELLLSEKNIPDFENHITFLRNLQKLRSTGSGHTKGGRYEKASQNFGLCGDNYWDVFNNILEQSCQFLSFLDNNFL